MVFFKALPFWAIPIAKWLLLRDPSIFREDFEAIREIAGVKTAGIFKSEMNRFHGRNIRDKGWIRGTLGIRLSAKRLIRLKNQIVFRKHGTSRLKDDQFVVE